MTEHAEKKSCRISLSMRCKVAACAFRTGSRTSISPTPWANGKLMSVGIFGTSATYLSQQLLKLQTPLDGAKVYHYYIQLIVFLWLGEYLHGAKGLETAEGVQTLYHQRHPVRILRELSQHESSFSHSGQSFRFQQPWSSQARGRWWFTLPDVSSLGPHYSRLFFPGPGKHWIHLPKSPCKLVFLNHDTLWYLMKSSNAETSGFASPFALPIRRSRGTLFGSLPHGLQANLGEDRDSVALCLSWWEPRTGLWAELQQEEG